MTDNTFTFRATKPDGSSYLVNGYGENRDQAFNNALSKTPPTDNLSWDSLPPAPAKPKIKRDTNADMMNATHALVVENGCYEKAGAIMDYFLPAHFDLQELTDYEFDFVAVVNFGGSEGIYIDCYISGEFDNTGKSKRLSCGTYKTLSDDLEAMQIMGELAGSLTYYNNKYVNKELDRYTPDKERRA